MKHELRFLRLATRAKDGFDGMLYRHSWGSGYQDIVFPSQRAANAFLKDVASQTRYS